MADLPSVRNGGESGSLLEKKPNNPSTQLSENDANGNKANLEDTDPPRSSWGGQLEFILTIIGYAVGLGNVWRFPYLCYKNGGGAFLLPYLFMLAVVGIPVFFLEVSLGQFSGRGPTTAWTVSPLFKGVGIAAVVSTAILSTYYNVVNCHVLFYLGASMQPKLPWSDCNNTWNSHACIKPNYNRDPTEIVVASATNMTYALLSNSTTPADAAVSSVTMVTNTTKHTTPAEDYFNAIVLEKSIGLEDFGYPSWKLTLSLLGCWVVVALVLIKGTDSLGKAGYFTAIFPYVMLTALLIRGVTLPGASKGIIYYLKPDFNRLTDSRVWLDALTQVFFSLSACTGGLISLSSYNKFHNNALRDSVLVALVDTGTSVYAGFVIFSVLGFMAHQKNVPIEDVAAGGPGLAFVVYPEGLSQMPVAPLWSVFFFLMMAALAFGSQFSYVECVMAALLDEFPVLRRTRARVILFRVTVCFVGFLLGIPMLCKGGIYLLNLIDFSISGFPLLFIGLFEFVALTWIYGYRRFAADIQMMLGRPLNVYWRACWVFISPALLLMTILFACVRFKQPSYKETDGAVYHYPNWALAISWMTQLTPIVCIPAWFFYQLFSDGAMEMLKRSVRPLTEWGPREKEDRRGVYAYIDAEAEDKLKAQTFDISVLHTRQGFFPETSLPQHSTMELA